MPSCVLRTARMAGARTQANPSASPACWQDLPPRSALKLKSDTSSTSEAMASDSLSTRQPIPVSLLTGFLGSGKTTLLNHLVRQPALSETLVIINEFGAISLDHLLVKH